MYNVKSLDKSDIIYLFNEVWPAMNGAHLHREHCLKNIDLINSYFRDYKGDPDSLLKGLCSIENIAPTIASGLIYAGNRDRFVPFDGYTMYYALEKSIIYDFRITDGENYSLFSRKIVEYINQNPTLNTIRDFVLEAREQAMYKQSPA